MTRANHEPLRPIKTGNPWPTIGQGFIFVSDWSGIGQRGMVSGWPVAAVPVVVENCIHRVLDLSGTVRITRLVV